MAKQQEEIVYSQWSESVVTIKALGIVPIGQCGSAKVLNARNRSQLKSSVASEKAKDLQLAISLARSNTLSQYPMEVYEGTADEIKACLAELLERWNALKADSGQVAMATLQEFEKHFVTKGKLISPKYVVLDANRRHRVYPLACAIRAGKVSGKVGEPFKNQKLVPMNPGYFCNLVERPASDAARIEMQSAANLRDKLTRLELTPPEILEAVIPIVQNGGIESDCYLPKFNLKRGDGQKYFNLAKIAIRWPGFNLLDRARLDPENGDFIDLRKMDPQLTRPIRDEPPADLEELGEQIQAVLDKSKGPGKMLERKAGEGLLENDCYVVADVARRFLNPSSELDSRLYKTHAAVFNGVRQAILDNDTEAVSAIKAAVGEARCKLRSEIVAQEQIAAASKGKNVRKGGESKAAKAAKGKALANAVKSK